MLLLPHAHLGTPSQLVSHKMIETREAWLCPLTAGTWWLRRNDGGDGDANDGNGEDGGERGDEEAGGNEAGDEQVEITMMVTEGWVILKIVAMR